VYDALASRSELIRTELLLLLPLLLLLLTSFYMAIWNSSSACNQLQLKD